MYNFGKTTQTSIKRNTSYQGERIEEKIARIVNNKEPITDGAPIIYTDRSEGTRAEYNIRTDRWEVAVDAMDYVTKSQLAKREQRLEAFKKKIEEANGKSSKKDGGTETPATPTA